MHYKFKALAILMMISLGILAQHDEYVAKEFLNDKGDTLLYRQLSPETVVQNKKYPLVLFLHGAGER